MIVKRIGNTKKLSRYSLIGVNNISNAYVRSISNIGLIDRKQEKELSFQVQRNKALLIKELFGTPYISELFIDHVNKMKNKLIHAKYVLDLNKYVSNANKEESGDFDDLGGDNIDFEKEGAYSGASKKNSKKNIFNNINNVISKIKDNIGDINNCLAKLKACKDDNKYKELLEELSNCYVGIYLSEDIVKEMYYIYYNYRNELLNIGNDKNNNKNNTNLEVYEENELRETKNKNNKSLNKKFIFGLREDEFEQRYIRIVEYYRLVVVCENKMILHNLRLVISIGKKYVNKRADFMDIVQEGNKGLARAAKKFEPAQDCKFSTYATWWVIQAITRSLHDLLNSVRVPVHMLEIIGKVMREESKLSSDMSYEDKIEAIYKVLKVDKNKIRRVFKIKRGYLSFDYKNNKQEIEGEDDSDFTDYSSKSNLTPYDYVVMQDKRRIIKELTKGLSPRERDIFNLRFMENDKYNQEMTLEVIGYLKGITRERVRQIIHIVISKLLYNEENEKYRHTLYV